MPEFGYLCERWSLQGHAFFQSAYFTGFVQSLKQDRHPSSKHHLTNPCKVWTTLHRASFSHSATETSLNVRGGLKSPEEQAWDYFPLILLMLPGICIASITYPVPTGVLLQVLRCWGFIPPYLKIHAWDTVFSLALQLCSPWFSWDSVWTLENWEGRQMEGEETLCYISFF